MNFGDYIKDIHRFYEDNGVKITPLPKIKLENKEVDRFDPLIPTGNYNPIDKIITLYIDNRHIKDILRSYCHELIHHNQNISDEEKFSSINKNGNLVENKELENLESDAYSRGNLMFRKWTEQLRK